MMNALHKKEKGMLEDIYRLHQLLIRSLSVHPPLALYLGKYRIQYRISKAFRVQYRISKAIRVQYSVLSSDCKIVLRLIESIIRFDVYPYIQTSSKLKLKI